MYLTAETKNSIMRALGRDITQNRFMSMPEEMAFVKERTGHAPHFSKEYDPRMQGRGNPLISRRRICTMEDVNKWAERLQQHAKSRYEENA